MFFRFIAIDKSTPAIIKLDKPIKMAGVSMRTNKKNGF